MYVWHAVGAAREVLNLLIQPKRDKRAASKQMRKMLGKQAVSQWRDVAADA